MSFAFHKLYPRLINFCEEIFVCTPGGTTTIYTTGGSACNPCVPSSVSISGSNCTGSLMNDTGIVEYPGCPKEFRLSGGLPHPCTIPNITSGQSWPSNAREKRQDPGTWYSKLGYFYRTPSSPSAPPTEYDGTPLCIGHSTYTIHDRVMIISGRNRYRYAGWLVDPEFNSSVPLFWNNIKQHEESITDGREFPALDAVLNYPLWGAVTSENPVIGTINACGQLQPCINPEDCFTCRENDGVGHFLSASLGNGNGYLSFQCFNPDAYWVDPIEDTSDLNGMPIPTCSLWSLIRGIWTNFSTRFSDFTGGLYDAALVFADLKTAYDNLIGSDPSGTFGQKSNVRYYLEQFAAEVELMTVASGQAGNDSGFGGLGWKFVIPNVFLWNRTAYNAATGSDKWKHIYIVGNGNVLFDSGCISTASSQRYAFLDEVSHDFTPNSPNNARVIQFFGCNDKRSDNSASVQRISMSVAPCSFESNPNEEGWCVPCGGEGSICGYERTNCPIASDDPYEPYSWING